LWMTMKHVLANCAMYLITRHTMQISMAISMPKGELHESKLKHMAEPALS